MPMLVMHVGCVRMGVLQGPMLVWMSMRLPWRVLGTVLMPVVFVMHV